jgi:hypothetical protein
VTLHREQVVTIAAGATTFTVLCAACADDDAGGYGSGHGASFVGRLDVDLDGGVFLCRRGHTVVVERERPAAEEQSSSAAA